MFGLRDVLYEPNLPCDTLLHNCSGDWPAFVPVRLVFRTDAGADVFAVLRAVRRPDLDPSGVRVPAWVAEYRRGPERAAACWLAEAATQPKQRHATDLDVRVQLVGDRDTTVAPAALERGIARALRSVVGTGAAVRAGLLVGVPVAGRFVVAQVVGVDAVEGGGAALAVHIERAPVVHSALERALLQCYGPTLQPRMAQLLRAGGDASLLRTLLLVAHAAIMATELCVLVADALGAARVTVLHAEDVVLRRHQWSASADDDDDESATGVSVVVLAGLEGLSQRDSHAVAQWLEGAASARAIVVIVVHNLEDVSRDLISASRVGVALKLHAPALAQRAQIVAALIDVAPDSADAHAVAAVTGGFSVRDLQRFCDVLTRTKSLEEARLQVSASAAMQQERFEPTGVTWADTRGCDHVRHALHRSILWPIRHPARLAAMGCAAPAGVLLYGPPGCGKSMSVNAFAAECAVNLVQVRATQLLSRYTGQTEAAIRRLFAHARTLAPCVLFFDELDVIAPSRAKQRAEDAGGASERLVSTLLNELDGIDTVGGTTGVYVLACSTRPWALDAAIVRPGRLDRLVHIGLPNHETRVQLLELHGMASDAARECAWTLEGMTCAAVVSMAREACGDAARLATLLGKYELARVPAARVQKYEQFSQRGRE